MSTPTGLSIATVNPATEQILETYEATTPAHTQDMLKAALVAQRIWRQAPVSGRCVALRTAGHLMRERRTELATLITKEMGKPISQAVAEIEKSAGACEYYADVSAEFLQARHVSTAADRSFVSYEPLGVVLGIMPWNFPFWQAIRFLAPALAAGNAVLLKHASTVSGSALALQRLLLDAGLPENLLSVLLIADEDVPTAVQTLIEDPRICAVTITGSERAGVAVATAAGQALKKAVLELGGSDPFVVLADADLESVAATAVAARFANGGQSCISPKRLIVVDTVADEFEQRLIQATRTLRVGDPLDPAIDVGPLARSDLLETLQHQIDVSVSQKARLLLGGKRLPGPGFFFEPTVLGHVEPRMPVFSEETFGPVASVIRAADDAHAVRLANQTSYGLGASVWTRDVAHGLAIGAEIESGALFINSVVASDVRLPFGGIKRSGYGRELSVEGMREFVNIRTVYICDSP